MLLIYGVGLFTVARRTLTFHSLMHFTCTMQMWRDLKGRHENTGSWQRNGPVLSWTTQNGTFSVLVQPFRLMPSCKFVFPKSFRRK